MMQGLHGDAERCSPGGSGPTQKVIGISATADDFSERTGVYRTAYVRNPRGRHLQWYPHGGGAGSEVMVPRQLNYREMRRMVCRASVVPAGDGELE